MLKVYYEPKEDITAYELALCMPFLIHKYGQYADVLGMNVLPKDLPTDERILRHFRVEYPEGWTKR